MPESLESLTYVVRMLVDKCADAESREYLNRVLDGTAPPFCMPSSCFAKEPHGRSITGEAAKSMERAYTLTEIDQMREAIHQILFPMRWYSRTSGIQEIGCYQKLEERDNHVEMRLRTYMMAGVDPLSLYIEADKGKFQSEEERLSYPEDKK